MESFTFNVGTIQCIAVHEGEAKYYAKEYVADGDEEKVVAALARHGHEPSHSSRSCRRLTQILRSSTSRSRNRSSR